MWGMQIGAIALKRIALGFLLVAAWQAIAQDAKTPYPNMAPIGQYLMEPSAEIALARSAAPEAISRDGEVMVLGRHGYDTVVQGKNGFVCMVERSWTSPIDDPGFWNPKGRAPIRRWTRPMMCLVNVKSVDRIIYSICLRFNLEWKTPHPPRFYASSLTSPVVTRRLTSTIAGSTKVGLREHILRASPRQQRIERQTPPASSTVLYQLPRTSCPLHPVL